MVMHKQNCDTQTVKGSMNFFNASIPIKNKKVKYILRRYPYKHSTKEAAILCAYAQTKIYP